MSARWSTFGSPATCSGAMYAGVPSDMPSDVSVLAELRCRAEDERLRDAEVGDGRRAAGEQDVVGLDVAVDDAVARARTRAPSRRRARMLTTSVIGSGPRGEARAQRLALHERHHVVRQPVDFAGREHRHDVRMLQPRRELDLALEPLGVHARGELGQEHLDDDGAARGALSSARKTRDMPPPPSSRTMV